MKKWRVTSAGSGGYLKGHYISKNFYILLLVRLAAHFLNNKVPSRVFQSGDMMLRLHILENLTPSCKPSH